MLNSKSLRGADATSGRNLQSSSSFVFQISQQGGAPDANALALLSSQMSSGQVAQLIQSIARSSNFPILENVVVLGMTVEDQSNGGIQSFRLFWYYPDWIGHKIRCLHDGNEPLYMTNNPDHWMFINPLHCCGQWFGYDTENCVSDSVDGIDVATLYNARSPLLFFPDWRPDRQTCRNDTFAPTYMYESPSTWLFESFEACCQVNFAWNSDCSSISTSSDGTNIYYPSWGKTVESICLSDGNAEEYMQQSRNMWMFDKVEDCCRSHFPWAFNNCVENSR